MRRPDRVAKLAHAVFVGRMNINAESTTLSNYNFAHAEYRSETFTCGPGPCRCVSWYVLPYTCMHVAAAYSALTTYILYTCFSAVTYSKSYSNSGAHSIGIFTVRS